MYRIHSSAHFRKAFERLRKSGKQRLIHVCEEAVTLLVNADEEPTRSILRLQWSDHALTGNLSGLRELHLGQDDLLLYSIEENTKRLRLMNLVTHEELRKL